MVHALQLPLRKVVDLHALLAVDHLEMVRLEVVVVEVCHLHSIEDPVVDADRLQASFLAAQVGLATPPLV